MTRGRELTIVAWSALTFAALLASFTAFRPVRDALVLDGKPDELPWLFTTTFVAVSVASPAWSALLSRQPKRRVVPVAYHVFAACAVVFAWLVGSGVAPLTVGRVFYVWSAVFNLFVVSVFWSLLADLLGPARARRLYGPIAAGGTVGGFVGPLLTKLFVSSIGVAGVLVMSAILLELAVVGTWRVRIAGEALAPEPAEEAHHGGAFTGLREVARSPYLLGIVGYVLCTACAATFMYLEQGSIVHALLGDRTARTDYFATIDLWVAAATFVVQVGLAAPLLRWVGPGVVLLVLPLAQAAGITSLALAPSLATLAIAQIVSRTATHGLTRPARELLFTVVDRDAKYHAKNAIDTIGYRLGDFASSWLYKGLVVMSAGSAVLSIAAIPLTAIWISLAVALGFGFRRRNNDSTE